MTQFHWGDNTKKGMIRACADSGMSKRETFNRLRPLTESGIEPLVFKRNPTTSERNAGMTHRVPKSMALQLIDLKNEIGRTYSMLGRSESAAFDSPEIPATQSTGTDTATIDPVDIDTDTDSLDDTDTDTDTDPLDGIPVEEGSDTDTDIDSLTEVKPVRAKGKKAIADSIDEFHRRMKVCRDFLTEREFTDPIDELGLRPEDAAVKLIPAGVPVEALIDVMTMTWPEDARNQVNATKFDWEGFSRKLAIENQIPMEDSDGNFKHVMFPYIILLAEHRIPIWLGGPMGTGKSTLARQVADYLFPNQASAEMDKLGNVKQVNYGETALSAGATRGDLLGRLTASEQIPFILSKFCEIYSGGGVFCFEEIDAALPDVLITLNNALAGDYMFNSANGEDYVKHPDMVPIATANTWGTGANMLYLRERLDAATLDRFRMGRVLVRFDQRVADRILFGK